MLPSRQLPPNRCWVPPPALRSLRVHGTLPCGQKAANAQVVPQNCTESVRRASKAAATPAPPTCSVLSAAPPPWTPPFLLPPSLEKMIESKTAKRFKLCGKHWFVARLEWTELEGRLKKGEGGGGGGERLIKDLRGKPVVGNAVLLSARSRDAERCREGRAADQRHGAGRRARLEGHAYRDAQSQPRPGVCRRYVSLMHALFFRASPALLRALLTYRGCVDCLPARQPAMPADGPRSWWRPHMDT